MVFLGRSLTLKWSRQLGADVVSSLDRLDMGNSENTELWPCFGVGCAFFFKFLKKYLFVVAWGIFFSCSMWDLVPWPGIEPGPSALGTMSLSHCTREVPGLCIYMEIRRAGKDTSHSSARKEACSEDAGCHRPFVGREGGLQIVLKKYT